MYTIIGGDGKEYGPVSADQVRAWVIGGRANAQTKVKKAGDDAWKTVADFPELTNVPASAPGPQASPTSVPNVTLDIISCYERSWALLKANFWPLVGVCALIFTIMGALGYKQSQGLFLVSPLLGGVLNGGLYYYFLKRVRGQPATIGDAFAGFSRAFVPLMVAAILILTFVILGFFCILLPGIYLMVAYSFTYLILVDRQIGFWAGMEMSRKVVTRNWWRVFGLMLLSIPFLLLGVAALGIGIFVALPLITGAFVYAYEDLCNPKA